MSQIYDPRQFWEDRLSQNLDITTVGHAGLGYTFNAWLYRARFRAMGRALRTLGLTARGHSLLEVGSGSGAWIPFWQKQGVGALTGLDITNASVSVLRQRYPTYEFKQADITDKELDLAKEWDIVTAFDVLFHITNDDAFSRGMKNIAKMTKRNGIVILSDSFCKKPWDPYYHGYHRSIAHYKKEMKEADLVFTYIEPIFYTMSTTMCSDTIVSKSLFVLTSQMLALVGKLSARRLEWLNEIIGFLSYGVDGVLGRIHASSPSIKFLFARKQ